MFKTHDVVRTCHGPSAQHPPGRLGGGHRQHKDQPVRAACSEERQALHAQMGFVATGQLTEYKPPGEGAR
ncbi:hypothetical protein WME76_45090 (plasmid) [Sorangium sp. So ce119]|uniref:hypothetical protein n=1 Tax=Sorangium sp. So ce119 TaxID=3133279 RepID=UPI003F60E252